MKISNSVGIGILSALAGSLLFSTKAIFVKLAYHHEVDSVTLLLLRMLFALPFYIFMLSRITRDEWIDLRKLPGTFWFGLLMSALLGYYLSSLLDFMGLTYIDASVERLILFIYPTIIAIISYFVFRERLSSIQWIALITSYMGLVLVFAPHLSMFNISTDFWKGALLILACALSFAVFMVINQWLLPSFGSKSFTSLSMTVACIFVILHYLIKGDLWAAMHLDRQVYFYAFLMATVATVIPSYIVNYAIQLIGATRSAIMSIVAPISTISLAYWVLGERLFPTQIWGGILIITGVTLVSMEIRRRAQIRR